eukprot:gene12204-biopygen1764
MCSVLPGPFRAGEGHEPRFGWRAPRQDPQLRLRQARRTSPAAGMRYASGIMQGWPLQQVVECMIHGAARRVFMVPAAAVADAWLDRKEFVAWGMSSGQTAALATSMCQRQSQANAVQRQRDPEREACIALRLLACAAPIGVSAPFHPQRYKRLDSAGHPGRLKPQAAAPLRGCLSQVAQAGWQGFSMIPSSPCRTLSRIAEPSPCHCEQLFTCADCVELRAAKGAPRVFWFLARSKPLISKRDFVYAMRDWETRTCSEVSSTSASLWAALESLPTMEIQGVQK